MIEGEPLIDITDTVDTDLPPKLRDDYILIKVWRDMGPFERHHSAPLPVELVDEGVDLGGWAEKIEIDYEAAYTSMPAWYISNVGTPMARIVASRVVDAALGIGDNDE